MRVVLGRLALLRRFHSLSHHHHHHHRTPRYLPIHTHRYISTAANHFLNSSDKDGDDVDASISTALLDDDPTVRIVSSSPVDEPILLPVALLTSFLDSYHHYSALPWWAVIATSTLAVRFALLPVTILQMRKLKVIAEFLPKLPPPIPRPLSGRSYIDQLSLFRKERLAVGCPSLLWFLATFTVQAPCFILGMMTVRRMSLDQHPGFDCGGALWFQNLTEYPHGILGPIFPFVVACLHLLNIQVAFQRLSMKKASGLFDLLAKYYKVYLQILTVPILFAALSVPQGSLIYWATNSSSSLIQQLSLNHPSIRFKLGLPEKLATIPPAEHENLSAPELIEIPTIEEQRSTRVENLSPTELFALSIKHLAAGEKEEAVPLLRSALDKDPDYVRALIVMGQIHIQNGQLAEAIEYLESGISKLFLIGLPTEVEEIDLLILASQWAGVALIKQERNAEGIRHLERVANLKEPEDLKSKAHYYDAFVLLGSALYREGRKAEAAKYLRMAVAYNPDYQKYLDECENREDDFACDLASTRRRDY